MISFEVVIISVAISLNSVFFKENSDTCRIVEFFFKHIFILFLLDECVCLHVCLFAVCVPGPGGDHKWPSAPLEQGSPEAKSHSVGAWNHSGVLFKSGQCSPWLSHLSRP